MNNPSSKCIQYLDELVQISKTLQCKTHQQSISRSKGSEDEGDMVIDGSDALTASDGGHLDNRFADNEDMLDKSVPWSKSGKYYMEIYPSAAQMYGKGLTFMDGFNADKHTAMHEENMYYPWASQPEWELTSFLLHSSPSMAAIDQFLALSIVGPCYHLFHSRLYLTMVQRSNPYNLSFKLPETFMDEPRFYLLGLYGNTL